MAEELTHTCWQMYHQMPTGTHIIPATVAGSCCMQSVHPAASGEAGLMSVFCGTTEQHDNL